MPQRLLRPLKHIYFVFFKITFTMVPPDSGTAREAAEGKVERKVGPAFQ